MSLLHFRVTAVASWQPLLVLSQPRGFLGFTLHQTPLTWASALSCHRHGCTGHSPAVPLPTMHHSCCGRIPLVSDHLPSSCLGATRQPSDACCAGGSAMCYLGWEALHRVPSSPLQFCPRDWGLPLCSGVSPLCPLDVPGLGQVLAPTRESVWVLSHSLRWWDPVPYI